MPYPYDSSPFTSNPFNQNYSRLFAPRTPTARDLLPSFDPTQDESTAGWLLEQGIGGLGYLGSVLDKSFGGRGVRGLLGGKPEELLSILPFSDTLGITDQANEVSGRDLLADLGYVNRRQPNEAFSWQDDLPGMLAEVALDPSTYLTGGLSAAGKTALKAGGRSALQKGFMNQMRAGQRGLNFEVPFTDIGGELLSGPQVAEGLGYLRSGATLPTRGLDAVLGATTGYRPFQGAQQVAGDLLEPVGRYARRLFNPAVKDRATGVGQDVAGVVSEFEGDLERGALGDFAQRTLDLMNLGPDATPEFKENLMRSLMAKIEDVDPQTLLPERTKEIRDNLFSELEKYNPPDSPEYAENMRNLRQWRLQEEALNPANQTTYDMVAKPSQKMFLEGTLPGGEAMPTDTPTVQLLDSLRDMIDEGFIPKLPTAIPPTPTGMIGKEGHTPLWDVMSGFKAANKRMPQNVGETLEALANSDSRLKDLAKAIRDVADESSLARGVEWSDPDWVKRGGRAEYDANRGIINIGPKDSDIVMIHEVVHATTVDKMLRDIANAVVGRAGDDVAKFSTDKVNDAVANLWKAKGAKALQFAEEMSKSTKVSDPVRSLYQSYLIAAEKLEVMDYLKGGKDITKPGFAMTSGMPGLAGSPDKVASAGLHYGMGNVAEFIAEAMSDEAFQRALMSIAVDGPEKNLLVKFLNAIKQLLGITDAKTGTLFDSVVSDVEKLTGADFTKMHIPEVGNVKPGTEPLFASPAGAIRMEPGAELLAKDREFLRQQILGDEQFGPRSLVGPGGVDNKKYRKLLKKWAADPNATIDELFNDPFFGDLAEQAAKKLENEPQFRRVANLDKALEYQPPKGAENMAKWADANLTPEQKQAFDTLVEKDRNILAKFKEVEKSVGARGGSLVDSFVSYMTRQQTKFPAGDPRATAAKSASSYWRDLKASNEAFEHRKDIFKDVPGGTSTINELVTDARLSGETRTAGDEEVKQILRERLTGNPFPAKGHPSWKQAEGLSTWLKGLPPDHVASQMPYFSADLPQLMFQRQKGMNEVQAVAKMADVAIGRFAHPAEHFKSLGQESMSIKEFLTRANLTGADEGGSIWAQKLFAGPVAKGQPLTLDDVKDIHLEKTVAEDLLAMNSAAKTPELLKPVLEAYDSLSNLTKTYLTRPFLSFHTRNILSGFFNTWRSTGGVGSREQLKGVIDFLQGAGDNLIPGVSKDDLWKELVANRIAFTPNSTMKADMLGKGGEIVEQGIRKPEAVGPGYLDPVKQRLKQVGTEVKESPKAALNPLSTDNSFIKLMSDAGQFGEDFVRTNHYVTLRKKGWSPKAAGEEVLKYQIDYRNLSTAERNVFRRMFPWYSFSRGTLPTILSDLVDKPSNITMPMRAVTGGREPGEFVPEWIGEGAALPLGANPDGSQRYLSSFGLPIEDEAFKMLGSLIKGDVTRVAEQGLGATFPWLKFPLEATFGKQLFSGRPLSDLRPYEWADLGGVLNEKQARLLTEVVSQTPASRFGSTASKMMDERKSAGDQLLAMLTGARMTDVDQERALNAAITREIGSQLLGQPGVRSRQEVYVPIDKIPSMNPEDAKKYALYLNYEQRMRELAKQRSQQR